LKNILASLMIHAEKAKQSKHRFPTLEMYLLRSLTPLISI